MHVSRSAPALFCAIALTLSCGGDDEPGTSGGGGAAPLRGAVDRGYSSGRSTSGCSL